MSNTARVGLQQPVTALSAPLANTNSQEAFTNCRRQNANMMDCTHKIGAHEDQFKKMAKTNFRRSPLGFPQMAAGRLCLQHRPNRRQVLRFVVTHALKRRAQVEKIL